MVSSAARHYPIACRAAIVAVLAVLACWPATGRSMPLPSVLEQYLSLVRLSSGDRHRLMAGEPVAKLLDNEATEQVSVFGAIWIDVPVARYFEALRRIETWEQGGSFHITRQLSQPAELGDFDALRLTPAVVDDMPDCRLGDCIMKLDERAITAFGRSIDWSSPARHSAAEQLMRRVVFDYSTAYLMGGNDRMPVLRDRDTAVKMGDEFRAIVGELPVLSPVLQTMREFLVDYPHVILPGAESFLYWQETEFGLRPTIRVSHMTLLERAGESVVASKMVYASHYFRGAIELRVLLPEPARGIGFWLVTLTASRTDGMTGFTGLFVRHRVRSRAREGVETMMLGAKRRLEARR